MTIELRITFGTETCMTSLSATEIVLVVPQLEI